MISLRLPNVERSLTGRRRDRREGTPDVRPGDKGGARIEPGYRSYDDRPTEKPERRLELSG